MYTTMYVSNILYVNKNKISSSKEESPGQKPDDLAIQHTKLLNHLLLVYL